MAALTTFDTGDVDLITDSFPSSEIITVSVNMVLDSLIVIGLNNPEDVVRISDTQ